MIDVLAGTKRGQRQPWKCGWTKMARANVLPKQAGPPDVIIAVKISATNCRGGMELKPPENHANRKRAHQQIGRANRRIGIDPLCGPGFPADFRISIV